MKNILIILAAGLCAASCSPVITAKSSKDFRLETKDKFVGNVNDKVKNKIFGNDLKIQVRGDAPLVCGVTVPTTLAALNQIDKASSNLTVTVGSNLSAFGFTGTFNSKDIMISTYMILYKDFTDDCSKRAMVGIRLYVHASEMDIKLSSPTIQQVAAAVQLNCGKAEYKMQIFGMSAPTSWFKDLPLTEFNVDTISKITSAFDSIVGSLTRDTPIDPVIADISNGSVITQ